MMNKLWYESNANNMNAHVCGVEYSRVKRVIFVRHQPVEHACVLCMIVLFCGLIAGEMHRESKQHAASTIKTFAWTHVWRERERDDLEV